LVLLLAGVCVLFNLGASSDWQSIVISLTIGILSFETVTVIRYFLAEFEQADPNKYETAAHADDAE
jgi:hypothetical protein